MEAYIPQDLSGFLPGLFRVSVENLAKYWPQEFAVLDRLNLAAQYSDLGTWTTWPSFDLDLQYSAWAYLGIAFFVLCVVAHFFDETNTDTRHSRNLDRNLAFTPYEALATLFTPVSNCHPKHYRPILAHISTFLSPSRKGKMTVVLDLEKTWRALVQGHLEFKDESVLEDLFTAKSGEGVCVFGCLVAFEFTWRWRMSVSWSLLFAGAQLWIEKCEWCFGLRAVEDAGDVPNLDTCLVDDTLDLDFIPIPYIITALSTAKSRLILDPDFEYDCLNVEFTCLAPDVGFMSKRYLMCCATLLPSLGHNLSKSKKTALPFLVSFKDIAHKIEAISSQSRSSSSGLRFRSEESVKNHRTIQALKNISTLHADALELHENDMVFDRWVRSSFVARHGPDAWRETRLRLKWEAALLRAKVLVRWKVTVSVR